MKKIISILLCSVVLFPFISCNNEEDDIFSSSSAERLNAAVTDNTDLLMSSSNGWIMQYFPNPETEGYTYFMKFGKDSVTIAGENKYLSNTYKEEVSCWEIIADNGPVLTFNSYNSIFHLFSNPEDPNGDSGKLGLGLKGDYEFIILKSDENEIHLKGKKWGSYINLVRASENQGWKDYLTMLNGIDNYLFLSVPNNYWIHSGDTEVASLYNGSTHIWGYVAKGADVIADMHNIPFIIVPSGILLQEAYELSDGKSIQHFELNEDKSRLVCTDEGATDVYIDAGDPAAFYSSAIESSSVSASSAHSWGIGSGEMSSAVKSIYDRMVVSCNTMGRSLSLSVTYLGSRQTEVLKIVAKKSSSTITGYLDLKREKTANGDIKYVYEGKGDDIGLRFYNEYDGFADFINLLQGNSFTVGKVAPLNYSTLQLKSSTKSDVWFNVLYN